jgi:hypothetical protein
LPDHRVYVYVYIFHVGYIKELAVEIQKAKEFAKIALDVYSDEILPEDKRNIDILANLIRARDKAIIGRCFDAIQCEDGDYTIIRCNKVTREKYLDSILRDLD